MGGSVIPTLTEIHMNQADIHRVIEMAWEDKTSFQAIKEQYDLSESQVMNIMKKRTQTQ